MFYYPVQCRELGGGERKGSVNCSLELEFWRKQRKGKDEPRELWLLGELYSENSGFGLCELAVLFLSGGVISDLGPFENHMSTIKDVSEHVIKVLYDLFFIEITF